VSGPPDNIAAWLLAEGAPDAIALELGTERVTYAALRDRVRAVAGFVHTRHATATQRPIVPILGETSIELVVAYLGVLHAGAVPAPIASPSAEVLRGILEETGARLTLVAGPPPRGIELGDAIVACHHAAGAPLPPVGVPPDELASLMYTSGSTGRPRGVMVSTRNLWSNTRAILEAVPLTTADRVLVTLPLYYCYGASVIHTHLRAGATVVLTTATFPAELLAALSDTAATGLPAVPSIIQMLLARGALAGTVLPSLRYVMVSGGKLAGTTVRELRAALPAAHVYIRYGVTELTAAASFLPPARLDDKLGSIGRGVPGTPLRVERTDGTEVVPGSGQVGEILGRGDHVTLGYFADPDETARVFRGGAFHTGDVATVDAEGYITIVGREKEFVKTGGHRVAPQEVEEVLMQLAGVHAAAVCGVSHPMRGEALVAAIVPRDGAALTEAELRRHCAALLPAHKVPAQFRIVAALPKRPNGKLDRRALATAMSDRAT